MRRPIQIQLLLPFLSVVLLAIVLACVTIAYLGTTRARGQQEENLRRVVGTLTEATFPLTDRVLRQMSGLSGAEFVVLDDENRIQGSTLRLGAEEGASLARLPGEDRLENLAARAVVVLSGRTYLGGRVAVARRSSGRRGSLVVLYPEDQWGRVAREAASPALFCRSDCRGGRDGVDDGVGSAVRAAHPATRQPDRGHRQRAVSARWPSAAATMRSATWPSPSTR